MEDLENMSCFILLLKRKIKRKKVMQDFKKVKRFLGCGFLYTV